MPGILRKFLIFAAVDGLILQPQHTHSHRQKSAAALRIEYGSSNITRHEGGRRRASVGGSSELVSNDEEGRVGVVKTENRDNGRPLEAFGIVGIFLSCNQDFPMVR